jgi:hypothetical protein
VSPVGDFPGSSTRGSGRALSALCLFAALASSRIRSRRRSGGRRPRRSREP